MTGVRRSFGIVLAQATALAVGLFAPHADAGYVAATSYDNPGASSATNNATSFLAQQFTLNQTTTLTSIDAALAIASGTPTTGNLSMTIFNNVGGMIGSTAFEASMSTTGTLTSSFSDINFSFSGSALVAGTYWMELTSISFSNVAWSIQTAGINDTSPTGSINKVNLQSGAYNTNAFLTTINAFRARRLCPSRLRSRSSPEAC